MVDLDKLKTRELGKYFEQLFVSKIIKLGFDVFSPVLDKGIDFIVRKDRINQPRYFEIQVKSVREKGGRLTIGRGMFSPNQENLFLVFFNVKSDGNYDVYLMSSKDVDKIFHKQEQAGKRIYRLNATKGDLEKMKDYKWDIDVVPEAWK